MIAALRPGLRLVLPSGQVITLMRPARGGTEWLCTYEQRVRGEVNFRTVFLKRLRQP